MADIYTLGMDLGSTTSKGVVLKNGKKVIGSAIIEAGAGTTGPQRAFEACIAEAGIDRSQIANITATGYGRNSFDPADLVISELSAHALGVHTMYPEARTLLDIGGQDAKVMTIGKNGRLDNFLMNDKCAAGTGRFLEVMAKVLEVNVGELKDLDAKAEETVSISSTCTVFAESEVISQLAKGVNIPGLVRGICASVAAKAASLVKRLGVEEPLYMTGGVARNTGVVRALEKELGIKITVSEIQQLNGAFGAAVYGYGRVANGR